MTNSSKKLRHSAGLSRNGFAGPFAGQTRPLARTDVFPPGSGSGLGRVKGQAARKRDCRLVSERERHRALCRSYSSPASPPQLAQQVFPTLPLSRRIDQRAKAGAPGL